MGKISILTPDQKAFLAGLKKNHYFCDNFYFTGGTALAEYYLSHRLSEDLDFFSDKRFDNHRVLGGIRDLSKLLNFSFNSHFAEPAYSFFLKFSSHSPTKIDFGFFPYPRLGKRLKKQGILIDSQLDIAVNKLMTISQRTDIKDFVDLYFLLDKYSFWDLFRGVEAKFKQELNPLIIASDFLKIEEFNFLPKMIRSLELEDLKIFYRKLAKRLGKKSLQ
ncbi:MAG: nucleotidyl transferase AbiEii/AbiGii toxin family protein [Candidatus Shapirobacteria bacterium]